jgi:hypothetical protein
MQEEQRQAGTVQVKIDEMLEAQPKRKPNQFMRDGAVQAIAQFVVCDDQVWWNVANVVESLSCWWFQQVLAVVEKPVFRNCLTTMRPTTMGKDLPSTHNVVVYIHNEFVAWLKKLKNDILVSNNIRSPVHPVLTRKQEAPGKISVTADGWTADNTKGSFLGMTAHCVEIIIRYRN